MLPAFNLASRRPPLLPQIVVAARGVHLVAGLHARFIRTRVARVERQFRFAGASTSLSLLWLLLLPRWRWQQRRCVVGSIGDYNNHGGVYIAGLYIFSILELIYIPSLQNGQNEKLAFPHHGIIYIKSIFSHFSAICAPKSSTFTMQILVKPAIDEHHKHYTRYIRCFASPAWWLVLIIRHAWQSQFEQTYRTKKLCYCLHICAAFYYNKCVCVCENVWW